MKIHGRFAASLDFRRAELLYMSNLSWKFNDREAECWMPCFLMDWTGISEDGDGQWSFPLGLQMLGRSPGQGGQVSIIASPSSHCSPPMGLWDGHRMEDGSREMLPQ